MTTRPDQLHDKIEHLFATPDPFRSWLQAKDDEEIVGQAGYGDSCPLASFLHDNGIGNVFVWTKCVTKDSGDPYDEPIVKNPDWARDFITTVDTEHPVYGAVAPAISANEALATLNRITGGNA